MNILKKYGAQVFGPFLFLLVWFLPTDLATKQQQFLAIFAFTVFNWLFGTIPLYISGLIGVTLSVFINLDTATKIFGNFGHPIIFLFLGGFLLAKAFSNVGLDNRISLYLLTRSFIKGSISRLLFTLIALTAVFTMWISNTATTAMMLPLVLGTLKSLKIENKKTVSLILLSIAYSSSIGGIATPIGSPPNIIGIGMLEELVGIKITFFEWMIQALPISMIFLAVLFFLVHIRIKKDLICFDNSFLIQEYKKLPTLSIYEIITFFVFLFTILLWLIPSITRLMGITLPINLNPGAVAIFGSSLLFIFPLRAGRKILKSSDIKSIDWSSLMLFGAGLAMGKLLFDLGLAKMAGAYLIALVSQWHLFTLMLVVFLAVIFFTEFSSNTASANILLPIVISMSVQLKLDPLYLTMGVGIACSLAFMLPVATPPNAIVYGSELVSKNDMIKHGLALNIIYAFILAGFIYLYS